MVLTFWLEDFVVDFAESDVGMAVRKGQAGWLGYVSEFIAESKTSGLVQQAMERAGVRGIQVVSQQSPN